MPTKFIFSKSVVTSQSFSTKIDKLNVPVNDSYPIQTMSTQLTHKQFYLYSLFFVPAVVSLLSGTHELGHAIMILLFGGKVSEIAIFPYSLFLHRPLSPMGFISWWGTFTDTEYIFIFMFGTISSVFWATTVLLIAVKKQYNPVVELFAYWTVILFSVDATYPIIDFFIMQSFGLEWWFTNVSGDWQAVYEMLPWMQYLAPLISVLWLTLLFISFRRRRLYRRFEF